MRSPAAMGFSALALLLSGVVLAQQAATADPRLADPTFIRLRDEAAAVTKCADRTNPVPIATPQAQYPEALIRSRLQGRAITEGIVLADGSVKYARVMKADNPELGDAALEVLKRYRYKAATCGGKPVPAMITIEHTFSVR